MPLWLTGEQSLLPPGDPVSGRNGEQNFGDVWSGNREGADCVGDGLYD